MPVSRAKARAIIPASYMVLRRKAIRGAALFGFKGEIRFAADFRSQAIAMPVSRAKARAIIPASYMVLRRKAIRGA
ncbi:hypothetical protein V5H41_28525, partial [Salmonella enterica]